MVTELISQDVKITCPHCESVNCFQEDYNQEELTLSAYLCLNCGFTTSTINEEGSAIMAKYEENMPSLFSDLKFVDPKTKLVWYPMVLNFPTLGMVFPDGSNALSWQWRAVPITAVKKEEEEKFPIPGKKGEFYKTKADMEASRLYPQGQFHQACKFLGIIVD